LPDIPLAAGALGDVLVARQTARALIADQGGGFPDPSLTTLTLAAACLHVAGLSGGELRRADLRTFLQDLRRAEETDASVARHPSQFVRYAAAELDALPPDRRSRLLDGLLALVAGGTEGSCRASTGVSGDEGQK
jgi:hypothetical protein